MSESKSCTYYDWAEKVHRLDDESSEIEEDVPPDKRDGPVGPYQEERQNVTGDQGRSC